MSSNSDEEAPQWLQKKVYSPKMKRTADLVKASVDALISTNQPVSKATVVAKSKELDPEGRGVCASAISRNPDAFAYYEQHRNYKEPPRRKSPSIDASPELDTLRVKIDRNIGQVRQRYLRLTKQVLADRLITLENQVAQQREDWYQRSDQLFSQLLTAETDERCDDDFQVSPSDHEKVQDLVARIERLKSEKRELKARLFGLQALEAENEQLRREKTHLMNQLRIFTTEDRNRSAARFTTELGLPKQTD